MRWQGNRLAVDGSEQLETLHGPLVRAQPGSGHSPLPDTAWARCRTQPGSGHSLVPGRDVTRFRAASVTLTVT